jgi:hypothetical protein
MTMFDNLFNRRQLHLLKSRHNADMRSMARPSTGGVEGAGQGITNYDNS